MQICKKIILFIPGCLLAIWGYISAKESAQFYEVSFYQLLNLGVVIYVAFYLVQKYTDKRLLKQSAQTILDKLQVLINDNTSYKITDQTDKDKLLMIQRQFKNKMLILNRNKDALQIKKEVEYIDSKYSEYCDFVGTHIDDLEYLKKSEKDLIKYLNLIDNKFDEIRMLLHK